jgi:hypothetical protein
MMEPGSFDNSFKSVPPPPVVPMYQLRPLSIGEVLDRTFSLYRRRFWLYCGISAISASLLGILQITEQMFMGPAGFARRAAEATPDFLPTKLAVYGFLGSAGTLLLYLVAYAVTQAATASAVTTIYLGHDTSISKALKVAGRKWWRYIFIALWQGWSSIWIFVVLLIPAIILMATKVDFLIGLGVILTFVGILSLAYGVVAYLRNSLAVPASVFEGLSVRKSMRRSKTLAKGRVGPLFLLGLMMSVLGLVAGMLQTPFALMMVAFTSKPGLHLLSEALTVLITFITGAVVAPIRSIALCLFYIDQRVRQEGFDLEAMMDPTIGSGTQSRVPPPPPPPPVFVGGFAPSGFTDSGLTSSGLTTSGFAAPPAPFAPSGFAAEPAPSAPSAPFVPSGLTGGPEPAGDGG